MLRLLAKVLLALFLLLVLLAGITVLYADYLAKAAVERGAGYVLGTPTRVASASVGLGDGKVVLEGLNVANPPGFSGDHFLYLGRGQIQIPPRSLSKDIIHVPRLTLEHVDIVLERNQKEANYAVVLAHVRQLRQQQGQGPAAGAAGQQPQDAAPAAAGRKFIIDEVLIRDVRVHVDLLPLPGAMRQRTLVIPEIRLENVGAGEPTQGPQGVMMEELSSILVRAVLQGAMEAGLQDLPGEVAQEIRQGLGSLDDLAAVGLGVVGDAGQRLSDKSREVGSVVELKVGAAAQGARRGAGQLVQRAQGYWQSKTSTEKDAGARNGAQ